MRVTERTCAAEGFTSYRYKGAYSFVMIGAVDTADALNEAERSIRPTIPTIDKLEVWNGEKYVSIS